MKNAPPAVSSTVLNLDVLPDSALATTHDYTQLTGRSRSSFYRDAADGLFSPVRVGKSVRVRVGDLRRILGAPSQVTA